MSVTTLPSYSEGLKELRSNLKSMLPQASLEVFDKDADHLSTRFQNILKVKSGDKAPDFTLTNAVGDTVNLFNQLRENRIVLVFYRGTWCPYCNLALSQYQSMVSTIKEYGANLIAVSAQTPDESLSIKEKNNLDFEVLSDNGNLVARLYTTVFKNGNAPLEEMNKLGFDFDSFYENDSKEIPIPAVFIIEKDGHISYTKTEGGDYRNRTEAFEIIENLKSK